MAAAYRVSLLGCQHTHKWVRLAQTAAAQQIFGMTLRRAFPFLIKDRLPFLKHWRPGNEMRPPPLDITVRDIEQRWFTLELCDDAARHREASQIDPDV